MIFEKATMRWISGMHEFWYRLSDGWIGGNVMGAPILLLDVPWIANPCVLLKSEAALEIDPPLSFD